MAPEVTVCNSSTAIGEFSPAKSVVSPAYVFTNNNLLTKLLYTLVSVVPAPNITVPNPFTIDTCTGAISTMSVLRRFVASSYVATVRVDNFGILPLMS